MTKKAKNGLIEESVENTAKETPVKEVSLEQPVEKVEVPGHTTRAFRQ